MALDRRPGKISFPRGPVDVWAWERRVTGMCSCDPGHATVVLQLNGAEVEVPREESRFSVVMSVPEGGSEVVAGCRHHDGLACEPSRIALRQRLKPRPRAVIALQAEADRLHLDGSASAPSEADGHPIVSYTWRARRGNPQRLMLRSRGASAEAEQPRRDGEYYVSLKVTDSAGRSDTATAMFTVSAGRLRLPDLATDNAAWIERAVVYGVVPHNFGPDGFRSVTARLDDLSDLGIDAIWLSPCTDTKTKGHGYGVSDYFRLRRDYGTASDFRKLVKAAHARGLRVLMDFVPNHSSAHHPYMQHALRYGPASPYHAFYEWHDDRQYAYYFHWRHLPSLNYDNPEVRRFMTEAFTYWVREFDVDGFRVDAAWGIRLRRPDFWPEWRRELKRIKPDLLLLAEASARDPYYFTQGFDAAYDWTDDLGKWSMEFVFEDPDQIVTRLHAALTNEGRGFHPDALIFRFLNNNDTGPRLITRYGLEMEKVAAAMLLTLPGLPCIYTGQEVGAEFEPYRTPGPISFEGNQGLRHYYRLLISLRRRHPALHSRQWEIVDVRSDQQVYGYLRYADGDEQPLLVLLNFSPARAEAQVQLPARVRDLAQACELTDLLSGDQVCLAPAGPRALRLTLPASCARILVTPTALG